MAKLLIIPDPHGSTAWKSAVNDMTADYIIFMGDYFDGWNNSWPEQGDNFNQIVNFVNEDLDHRIMLIGNHDWSYLSQTTHGAKVSGHQNDIDNGVSIHNKIQKLLLNAKDTLKLAYKIDDIILSHAGFTNLSISNMQQALNDILSDNRNEYASIDAENIDFINKVFHARLNDYNLDKSNASKWKLYDESLDWNGLFDGSGDEPMQYCLWIRPSSLLSDSAYPKQIVGHTEVCYGDYSIVKKDNNVVVLTDSYNHKPLIIDTDLVNADNAMTGIEYAGYLKSLSKRINIVKSIIGSLQFNSEKVTDKHKMDLFIKEFGDKLGVELYNYTYRQK